MGDITATNSTVTTDPVFPEPTFQKVREDSNVVWQKIHTSDFFRKSLQAAVGIIAAVTFTVVILPASILLTAVSAIGVIALGLTSPALLHPGAAKVWRTVRNKIFGMLSDLVYLPNAVLITPLAFKPNISHSQKDGNEPLVVFVHGFLHNKTCWESLAGKLCHDTKDGDNPLSRRDIYAVNLGEPLTVEEIDHYARFLATKLEQIRLNRGLETLDVVLDCHSMGGLVAAHFATTYASMVGVNWIRLTSNGTPWHGTPMAYVAGMAQCGKEMTPDHSFQKELAEKLKPFGDRIFTIASKGDTIVPYESALGVGLDIPEDHRFTLDLPFGHLAMLHSEQGQTKNVQLIKEGIALSKKNASVI